jgi:hypothetical protein
MKRLFVVFVVASCAHNVNQDAASGPDARIKGAKLLKLDGNHIKESGIVTYPGGDRVDWKQIDLPTGKRGTLALELTYQTPRPGLSVAFDVFDGNQAPLDKAVYTKAGHTRTASIEHAKGTYFIRVYAPRRGDAGKYKLVADFTEELIVDPSKVDVSPPPKLADLPPIDEPPPGGAKCPDEAFDIHKRECQSTCPKFGAPAGWPPCKTQCPLSPPDASIEGCWPLIKKCPTPPDMRLPICNAPPPPPPPAPPVVARINHIQVEPDRILITIPVGTECTGTPCKKIEQGWQGTLLRDGSTNPLPGGTVTIVRVGKHETVLRISLGGGINADVVQHNMDVRMSPPAP